MQTILHYDYAMIRAGIWGGFFATTLLAPTSLAPLHHRPAPLGHVRGMVFDSLTMERVPNALVWLPGTTLSVFADGTGRFDMDSVPVGRQILAFSTPSLDSIGLGTLGGQVEVRADGVTPLSLATPSFGTVWNALCKSGTIVASDSGIAWGTVRDASNDIRQSNAATRFNWHDLHVGGDNKVVDDEVTRDVRTDSTGSYYACGLPLDIDIMTEADGTKSASGVVQYQIGNHRVVRVDLLVSTDMVTQPGTKARTADEQAAALTPHGTSSVHGTVRDAKGIPRAGVTVTATATDSSVTTDARGEFTFAQLPAGTQAIESRMPGLTLTRTVIDLRPGKRTDVDVTMTATNELETVQVNAVASAGHFRDDFENRKKAGFGTILEPKDFANAPDLTSVLHLLPFATVAKVRGLTQVQFPAVRLAGSGKCSPLIWVDGVRSVIEEASAIDVADLRAVESYPRGAEAPPQYVGLSQGCGVILFWSKRAKW